MANRPTHTGTSHDSIYDTSELVLPPEGCCFHCGEVVPNPPFTAQVLGESRLMCCMGCQLAAQSIVEAGLEQYYLDRSEINRTASMPTELERLQAYDHDEVKSQFVYSDGALQGMSIAELSVNNLRCAACTWLIETRLYELDGVANCQVNLTNQRMRVIWDESKLPISKILLSVNQIGYDAKPYRQDTHEAMLARYNKQMMIRLGIAALGAMQAMMFAVGMYFGEYSGMLTEQRDFLRWVSLFVSVPVFFYCAIPFFTSAWSAIKARQVNMDVPVSIALTVTFFASLYATFSGQGETYYDSVSMFVFFLLAGRYIEHNARLKAANMANDLVVIEPTLVQKVDHQPMLASSLLEQYAKRDTRQPVNNENNNISNPVAYDMADTINAENSSSDSSSNSPSLDKNSLSKLTQLGRLIHNLRNDNDASQSTNQTTSFATSQSVSSSPVSTNSKSFTVETVTAHSLKVGDVIMIEAGSEVVADGVLCSETATVSQSLLTGESDLIVKARGDRLIGGSQNDSQPFMMIVTALPEHSQIALIDRLMNRAMSEKPKVAEQADKWARWFVARILLLSAIVFIAWYLIDPTKAIWATVAVLVATCPCALSLATPIALTVATNRLAGYGFLTTRGHTIETLSEVTHVAFDKTGTLTYGKPNLLYIDEIQDSNFYKSSLNKIQSDDASLSDQELPISNLAVSHLESELSDKRLLSRDLSTKDSLLAIAAAMEVGSRHPIASALLDAAYQLHLPEVTDLVHYPAGGIEACVHEDGESVRYRLGHASFAMGLDEGMAGTNSHRIDLAAHQASTAVMLTKYVCDDASLNQAATNGWLPQAAFYFNDSIRDGMADMIASLHQSNIQTLILTGDPSEHASTVAKRLGIDTIYNGLSPADKVAHIQRIQANGGVVLMVGDGINDAPVLAAANVSTAIAGAADLAQVSSDSVILNGQVTSVMSAKRIADKAKHIIKQNLYWALGYNSVVLLPAAFGYVPPWLAAIGMSVSSLMVVLNALRLKRA